MTESENGGVGGQSGSEKVGVLMYCSGPGLECSIEVLVF